MIARPNETFPAAGRSRAGRGAARAAELTNNARLDVTSTVVSTGYTSDQYKDAAKEGQASLGGLLELRDVAYVDLSTSHRPMWSRLRELAAIIGDVARRAALKPAAKPQRS